MQPLFIENGPNSRITMPSIIVWAFLFAENYVLEGFQISFHSRMSLFPVLFRYGGGPNGFLSDDSFFAISRSFSVIIFVTKRVLTHSSNNIYAFFRWASYILGIAVSAQLFQLTFLF